MAFLFTVQNIIDSGAVDTATLSGVHYQLYYGEGD